MCIFFGIRLFTSFRLLTQQHQILMWVMDNNVFKETLNFSRIIYEYVVVVLVKMNLRGGLSTLPFSSRVSKIEFQKTNQIF